MKVMGWLYNLINNSMAGNIIGLIIANTIAWVAQNITKTLFRNATARYCSALTAAI